MELDDHSIVSQRRSTDNAMLLSLYSGTTEQAHAPTCLPRLSIPCSFFVFHYLSICGLVLRTVSPKTVHMYRDRLPSITYHYIMGALHACHDIWTGIFGTELGVGRRWLVSQYYLPTEIGWRCHIPKPIMLQHLYLHRFSEVSGSQIHHVAGAQTLCLNVCDRAGCQRHD